MKFLCFTIKIDRTFKIMVGIIIFALLAGIGGCVFGVLYHSTANDWRVNVGYLYCTTTAVNISIRKFMLLFTLVLNNTLLHILCCLI